MPQEARALLLAEIKAVYYAPDPATAELLAERFIATYAASYPALVRCFQEDLAACLVHLKYPLAHRKFIRTTKVLERAFVEEKRRTKVIPQHVNERGVLKLVYAVLRRASERWRRVKMTPLELETVWICDFGLRERSHGVFGPALEARSAATGLQRRDRIYPRAHLARLELKTQIVS